MRYLLDTHALLWRAMDSDHLSARASGIIDDPDNEVLVSGASAFELALKNRFGKLPGIEPLLARFSATMADLRLAELPITPGHSVAAGLFQSPHRDPFDRIIAAQAMIEGAVVVTKDRAFQTFPVQTLW